MNNDSRNGSIEYARFIGALAIVWFHLHMPGASTALAALPLFILLQIYFGFGRPLRPQIWRLLEPWAIWSAAYAFAKITQAITDGTPIASEFDYWMLLTGPSLPLWYLPFSLVAISVAQAAPRLMSWSMVYFLGITLSGFSIFLVNATQLPIPFAQWMTVIPAAVIGLFLKGPVSNRIVLSGGLIATGLMVFGFGWETGGWQTFVAVSAFAIAVTFVVPSTIISRKLSSLSFGIYLVHPAIYAIALYFLRPTTLLTYVVVASASVGLTLLLRRISPRLA